MILCGIEIKSNYAILSVVEDGNYFDLKIKKLTLEDDEVQNNIISFKESLEQFIKENQIKKIIIKKRSKKGNFVGGALTFKIETIIQLNSLCEVGFVSGQALSRFEKKNEIIYPKSLNKYQEQSYLCCLV
jgi:putative lipoic acid-binding regulatory protein